MVPASSVLSGVITLPSDVICQRPASAALPATDRHASTQSRTLSLEPKTKINFILYVDFGHGILSQ